jgi:small-conductance mechanosensitive channel
MAKVAPQDQEESPRPSGSRYLFHVIRWSQVPFLCLLFAGYAGLVAVFFHAQRHTCPSHQGNQTDLSSGDEEPERPPSLSWMGPLVYISVVMIFLAWSVVAAVWVPIAERLSGKFIIIQLSATIVFLACGLALGTQFRPVCLLLYHIGIILYVTPALAILSVYSTSILFGAILFALPESCLARRLVDACIPRLAD